MTTELQTQTEDYDIDTGEAGAAEPESNEQNEVKSSDSAPETQPEESGNAIKRINKITAEKYEQKRRADELEKRLRELESKSTQQTSNSGSEAPKPPTLPDDLFDEDAMRKYHADMISYQDQAALYHGGRAVNDVLSRTKTEEQERLRAQDNARIITEYAERGLASGLTIEQMQANEQILVSHGISPELGLHIMSDEKGASIVNHLASNPDALEQLNSMNPFKAAAFIESFIKPNLAKVKTVTSAPDPVESISGGGIREKDDFDRLCPGATFD